MKSIRSILLGLAIALLAVAQVSGDTPETKDMTEAEKACLVAMAPGENHEFLASQAGGWSYTGKYWPSPEAEPFPMAGKSEGEMVLDGRYLVERVTSDLPDGRRFEGIACTAFDNAAGEFRRTWIDNMNTAMSFATGELDASGRVLTFRSEFVDPATGEKGEARSVTRFLGENRHRMEFWTSIGGQNEFKAMEMEYVRDAGA